jgi:hypothetical protein
MHAMNLLANVMGWPKVVATLLDYVTLSSIAAYVAQKSSIQSAGPHRYERRQLERLLGLAASDG